MLMLCDPHFREDLRYLSRWVDRERRTALRVLRLMEAVTRDPYAGEGKPARLKYLDPDVWSRRIIQEHRLVYHVAADRVTFLRARYYYGA